MTNYFLTFKLGMVAGSYFGLPKILGELFLRIDAACEQKKKRNTKQVFHGCCIEVDKLVMMEPEKICLDVVVAILVFSLV